MNQCENSVALGRLLSGRELEQVARGIERVLESVSEAVDRGGFFPVFLMVGGGLGAGFLIAMLNGGKISLFNGILEIESFGPV